MTFNRIILALLCLLPTILFAQSGQEKIRLLDPESGMPIVSATFIYGEENGVSDENGLIRFSYSEGAIMYLSHINYGAWTLGDPEVQKAIDKKAYYRMPITIGLHPVTIIALKPQGPQPQGIHEVTYQDRLAHDAAGILNQIPVFSSIRKGGNYGFDPVFRGFKYDQLNVVLNGAQSATAACPNRMDPPTSQMAPNMVDRIEILKGPHALRYGAGFGGTINLIPSKLRFASDPDMYGRVSLGSESNGNILRGESRLGFSGPWYDVSLFASWSQGDDYTTGGGETVQAGFSRGSFGTQIGLKPASNQQLRVSAVYNRARDADFPALPMDLRDDDTWMFHARHDIQLHRSNLQSWNSTFYGSFVDHMMNNLLKPLDPRMLNAETAATTYNYGGRTESVWRFGRDRVYAGADVRVEGADGTRVREFLMGPNAGRIFEDNAWQDGRIARTALFSEYQIHGEKFNYVLSGRLELNIADAGDPATEFMQVNAETRVTQANPGFSAGIFRNFGNTLQTGFWLARVQRSGSLTERFINYFPVGQDPYEMLGNTRLEPEVNYQADLTVRWFASERSSISVDLFGAYLQDHISSVIDNTIAPRLPASPGVRQFVNIDNAFKAGFEMDWMQQLVAGISHRASVAYTYGQDLDRNEPLPEIAPLDFRYTLMGSYLKGRLAPEVTFRYVSEQSRFSEEFGEKATGSFQLLDVNVGYQITGGLSFHAGVGNLLDENYYEHLSRSVRGSIQPIHAPGRNVFANLNITF